MSDELISVSEIAKLHARHRSAIHKVITRLRIETKLIRSEVARGQKAIFISREDYELLKTEIESDQVRVVGTIEAPDWNGFLSIMQLEPEFDPGRYKIGFATSVEDRLRSHRTSAPFATVVRWCPCKLMWEKTAIESITRNCKKLHTEVFRTADIIRVVERGERFFEVMPKLTE